MPPLDVHHCFAFFSVTCDHQASLDLDTAALLGVKHCPGHAAAFTCALFCRQVCMLKQVAESRLQQVRQCFMSDMGLTTRLLPSSRSTLFPSTTNGKFSGSDGLAYMAIKIIMLPKLTLMMAVADNWR